MKKIVVILLSLTALTLVGLFVALPQYNYRYQKIAQRRVEFKLYGGATIDTLSEILLSKGVLTSGDQLLHDYASHLDSRALRVGNYVVEKDFSMRQILNTVTRGYQTPIQVTFNNVRTIEQLAGRVSRYTLADSLDFLTLFRCDSLLGALDMTTESLPSLFLPNTYEFYWTVTPLEFVDKMRQEHDNFWNEKRLAEAQKLGFTPLEIVTIGSIVSEETNHWDEMSDVAGVYINRLRVGMPLQADPTVKFAIGDFSIRRILNKHLSTPSPYNTYLNAGLPPGPIRIVDSRVIDKVLEYENHNYYYFCANADFSGSHVFAQSLSQHNRNAAAYHRALNSRGIR
ncbi:MAG: endolytic transglycosylase MltG [Rikenellaceae bacterium]